MTGRDHRPGACAIVQPHDTESRVLGRARAGVYRTKAGTTCKDRQAHRHTISEGSKKHRAIDHVGAGQVCRQRVFPENGLDGWRTNCHELWCWGVVALRSRATAVRGLEDTE